MLTGNGSASKGALMLHAIFEELDADGGGVSREMQGATTINGSAARVSPALLEEDRVLEAKELSNRQIGKKLGVDENTIRDRLKKRS